MLWCLVEILNKWLDYLDIIRLIFIAIFSNIWSRGLIMSYLDEEGHLYDELSEVATYKIDNTFCNWWWSNVNIKLRSKEGYMLSYFPPIQVFCNGSFKVQSIKHYLFDTIKHLTMRICIIHKSREFVALMCCHQFLLPINNLMTQLRFTARVHEVRC